MSMVRFFWTTIYALSMLFIVPQAQALFVGTWSPGQGKIPTPTTIGFPGNTHATNQLQVETSEALPQVFGCTSPSGIIRNKPVSPFSWTRQIPPFPAWPEIMTWDHLFDDSMILKEYLSSLQSNPLRRQVQIKLYSTLHSGLIPTNPAGDLLSLMRSHSSWVSDWAGKWRGMELPNSTGLKGSDNSAVYAIFFAGMFLFALAQVLRRYPRTFRHVEKQRVAYISSTAVPPALWQRTHRPDHVVLHTFRAKSPIADRV